LEVILLLELGTENPEAPGEEDCLIFSPHNSGVVERKQKFDMGMRFGYVRNRWGKF